jgi:hypothetical protein
MHGDALRTGLQAQGCSARDAWDSQVPGIANQGYFVEVDGKMRFHMIWLIDLGS